MSFDPNPNSPPMGHAAPKKSGSLKWILGGVGCFTLLIVLCVGGFGYVAWMGAQMLMNNPAFNEAVATVETSESVNDALGSPVTVGPPGENIQTSQNGQKVTLTYTVDVTGSEKSGEATIVVSGTFMQDDWVVDEITVAGPDGEDIPVDGSGLSIDIEEGTEGEN